MEQLIRGNIKDITPYSPGKPIKELEREYGIVGAIKLASNENPLGPSPKAVEAIAEALVDLHRYPDGSGFYLREKLAEKFSVSRKNIILGNGSDELIKLIVHAFVSPGEEVIISSPTFSMYEKTAKSFEADIITVPLSNFSVDLRAVLNAISARTKMVFINNPNNPTGKALTSDHISNFLYSIPSDIIVVLDEAYIEFATDKSVSSAVEMIRQYPLLVVLRTFSKAYGLAGLRIGYGISSKMIIDGMNLVRQPFNANHLAQIGALAALDDEKFLKKSLETITAGITFLYSQLNQMNINYVTTQANFFLIKTPLGARETYKSMLKEGVIIRSMEEYGLKDYIRINVGLEDENKRFITTFKKILSLIE